MELIRTLNEKPQISKEADVQKQAHEKITLSDFDSQLYIAYAGSPLVPIEENWTSKEILNALNKLRQDYIKAKINN